MRQPRAPIGSGRPYPHAHAVKSGKRTVSIHVFTLVALSAAALAGREGEDGTGSMWIAPELVAKSAPFTAGCSLPTRTRNVELRFEMLDPRDIDSHSPQLSLQDAQREIVKFDWNPATSQLTYRSAAGSNVFSDLALPSDGGPAPASCGSR